MYQRLEMLKLIEELGNVNRVCKERDISHTQFYEYRRRFWEQGFEGLRDLPPIHKTHPQTTSPEAEKRILELAAQHPQKGCGHIEQLLKPEGKNCSKPHHPENHGTPWNGEPLSTASQAWRATSSGGQTVQPGTNSIHRKRHPLLQGKTCGKQDPWQPTLSGHPLCRPTQGCREEKSICKHAVDTYGSVSFGYLHIGKLPQNQRLFRTLQQNSQRRILRHGLETETLQQRGRTPEGSGWMAQTLQYYT